jgi:hypothetical protein
MIYEMRTYDIRPRSLPEVERRFGAAYEKRKQYSELTAFWHTEIGPLNQIIHVWGYKTLEERAKIREAAVKNKAWPPPIAEFILKMQSDIMIPFDISPELKPGKQGPYFEIRTYSYAPGDLPILMENWRSAIDVRLQFGPVTALWYTELGNLNKFIHIWPYKSLDERALTRSQALATGNWPPALKAHKDGRKSYTLVAQENKIVTPSVFSPLQ